MWLVTLLTTSTINITFLVVITLFCTLEDYLYIAFFARVTIKNGVNLIPAIAAIVSVAILSFFLVIYFIIFEFVYDVVYVLYWVIADE